MKFGLSICAEEGRFSHTVEQGLKAEVWGYDSIWVAEHHLVPGYYPSPMIALAALAMKTQRITLGTNVILLPFYNPVRVAEDAAVLDEISGGRLVLGVGVGYRQEEFDAFGIPYSERGKRTEEGLRIIRSLFTEEGVTFKGRCYNIKGVSVFPRPTQKPGPPIWVGGWAEKAIERAARLGDAWFPGPTADMATLKTCLAVYRRALKEAGRETACTELPIFREVFVARDGRGLKQANESLEHMYLSDYVSWSHPNIPQGQGRPTLDDLKRDRFILGTPEQVAAEIARYRGELGITHLVCRMHFFRMDQERVLDSMRLFSQEVIPQFQR